MPSKKQKQLRQDIKNLVNEINARLVEYYDSDEQVDIFDRAIEQVAGKARSHGRGGGISTGWNLRTIKDLTAYKKELNRLLTNDMFTPKAIEREKRQQEKAKRNFMKNHPEYTDEDYEVMSEAFSKLSEEEVMIFNSDEVNELAKEARKKNMSGQKFGDIIHQKIQEGKLIHSNPEQIQIAVLNSIKYGRYNRGR